MTAKNLEKLSLEELQEKRNKTKRTLSLGIGASIAFILVFIIIFVISAKYINELGISQFLIFLSGLFMFSLTVFPAYKNLRSIEKELDKRE